MNYNFEENEMPYSTLGRFGLTQAMIDDLPTDVLHNIYNGHRSPTLPVSIISEGDEEVKARTQFGLIRTQEGGVDVLFYPQLEEYDLQLFNDQQKQNLITGKRKAMSEELNVSFNSIHVHGRYSAFQLLSSVVTFNM